MWPGCTIWQCNFGSTLIEAIALCMMPSNYLLISVNDNCGVGVIVCLLPNNCSVIIVVLNRRHMIYFSILVPFSLTMNYVCWKLQHHKTSTWIPQLMCYMVEFVVHIWYIRFFVRFTIHSVRMNLIRCILKHPLVYKFCLQTCRDAWCHDTVIDIHPFQLASSHVLIRTRFKKIHSGMNKMADV